MRKKRTLETQEQRNERLEKEAQTRGEDSAAEDRAMDNMVKRSLKLHGP
jgi:hypothetical protein